MITIDMIRSSNPRIDEAGALYLADLWNTAYPLMRARLTDSIAWCRDTQRRRPDWDPKGTARTLKRCETIRRELGQLDRGTHRGCGRMTPAFTVFSAANLVQYTLRAVSFDDSEAGHIYRLAAELCDLKAAAVQAVRDEDREAAR